MFIQTETTPNPATLKFLPGREVMEAGTVDFANVETASRSPLATRLFAISGVTRVFFGNDFVTVTKGDEEWQHIKPAILGAIMEHYMSGAAVVESDEAANDDEHSGVVSAVHIDYLSPARAGDELVATAEVAERMPKEDLFVVRVCRGEEVVARAGGRANRRRR